MMHTDTSPALQLVQLVWAQTKRRSWIGLNHIMQDALALAITAQLRFDPSDIQTMWRKMRGGYWFTGADSEWIHRLACLHNTSAAVAYERHIVRSPFFLDGRLYVSREVDLQLLNMENGPGGAVVTSFSKGGEHVNIGVFAGRQKDSDGVVRMHGKMLKRIRLSLSQVRELEKARKSARKAGPK